jgi:hypothetical protein
MFLQQFFNMLGLTRMDIDELWPENSRARKAASAAQLQRTLQQKQQALIRRRCLIEKLRCRMDRAAAQPRRELYQSKLEKHEHFYQALLRHVRHGQRRLRSMHLMN